MAAGFAVIGNDLEMVRAADQAALEIRVTSSYVPADYFFSTAVVTVGAAGGGACAG